jgi:hypothetical protein
VRRILCGNHGGGLTYAVVDIGFSINEWALEFRV